METVDSNDYIEIKESLAQIRQYLETDINNWNTKVNDKETELNNYRIQLEKAHHLIEGNRQIINKLLGDQSKLQNDIDWYKRTYVQRSFLGTIRENILKRISKYF